MDPVCSFFKMTKQQLVLRNSPASLISTIEMLVKPASKWPFLFPLTNKQFCCGWATVYSVPFLNAFHVHWVAVAQKVEQVVHPRFGGVIPGSSSPCVQVFLSKSAETLVGPDGSNLHQCV